MGDAGTVLATIDGGPTWTRQSSGAEAEIFVFVDECHRTQSGKLHRAMRALDRSPVALRVGFTGTPLPKRDKQKSIEVFGPYIHTYKYDEAVRDGVVLDLRYEARDIDQSITSQAKIDQWFEAKTSGLTDLAKAQLKQRWGTMQKVLSSQDRLGKIVADILLDMETRDRLRSGHGNAMLVCDSIYSACRFYEMFQNTDLAAKCAVITSYKPAPGDTKGEESGEGPTQSLRQYDIYRKMLAAHFDEPEDAAVNKVELFETEVKRRFIEEPGQMKLLIVVNKLLTGFDAPPATYLYIDQQMRDHGLFQAICRVNRLDGEDKEYGHSGDYIDMKMYEPAMRHLLDTYIRAEDSETISAFDDMSLVELIVERGEEAVESLPEGIRTSHEAMAETIENNVRRLIIDEAAVNPKYYEKMSELLDALVRERKQQALDYKAYLARIVELTRQVSKPETRSTYPAGINSPARRALYDNLDQNEELATNLDSLIRHVKKAGWRGNRFKEREVRFAVQTALGDDDSLVDAIFEIVKNQRDY